MQIFLSVWREFYRQKSSFIFTIMFPVAMVFILGTLLEQWNVAENKVPTLHIAYVTQQEDPAFDQYLEQLSSENMLKLTRGLSLEEALQNLDDTYCAVVENKREMNQVIIHQGSDEIANRTLHILLRSFTSMEEAVQKAYESGVNTIEYESFKNSDYIKTKKLGIERTMIDYYAVSMIVMILFMGVSIAAGSTFYEFRKKGLESRVSITPEKKLKIFVMMLLGNLPIILLMICSIMFCSVTFFGAEYAVGVGANLVLILYFVLLAMTVNAFGAIVGLLLETDPTIVLLPICWVVLFFGGSFANTVDFGMLTRIMPTNIVQQAVFDLTLFGNYERIVKTSLVMCCFLFVLCGIGILLFTKKNVRRGHS